MVGEESEYLPNVTCSNWAVGQIEYRGGKICYWNGTSYRDWETDRKSTRLNSSHSAKSRMPSSA